MGVNPPTLGPPGGGWGRFLSRAGRGLGNYVTFPSKTRGLCKGYRGKNFFWGKEYTPDEIIFSNKILKGEKGGFDPRGF